MLTERVIEVPWALRQLPQTGTIMDAGSCEAWYRQCCPLALLRLFQAWRADIADWGFSGEVYDPISEEEVEAYDYRDYKGVGGGAGVLAAIVAHHA